MVGNLAGDISWNNLAFNAEADGDLLGEESKVFPPMIAAVAKSWGGDNASRYVKPVNRDVHCESEFYWWAESAVTGVFAAAPYAQVCDFTAQAVKLYIKERPQEFLQELTCAMMHQEPFSMAEFCLKTAIHMLADLMFVPGKKLAEAIGDKSISNGRRSSRASY